MHHGALACCLVLALWSGVAARAESLADSLNRATSEAGLEPRALAQPVNVGPQAPALYRRFMVDPPSAWRQLDDLAHRLPALRRTPDELVRQWLALGTPPRPATATPVAAGAPVPVPDNVPEPWAGELKSALRTLALAEAWRQKAFAALPPDLSPATAVARALPSSPATTDWMDLGGQVDTQALLTARRLLLASAQRLRGFLAQTPAPPPMAWRAETEWGTVLVDTTGQDNHHRIAHPFFVLDVGGNDSYDFGTAGQAPRAGVKLLLDHGGDDHYRSLAPGADASAAVMGVALQWDTTGDDHYEGGWLAQGAAVLGSAMLIDDAGDNHFQATGMAQGFALAGLGMLLGSPGQDHYRALTWAQASAGPQGLALLLDPDGDDHYRLGNEVLVWPSSQLPDRNASMGQGAAFGGLALLLDAAGNDRYEAQLFAQGAGYRRGTGLLIDLDGNDRHEAAWYAMGAAAHQAVGVLWDAGAGQDHYEASHVTVMGAGHDLSVGMLVDGGGPATFKLGDLGLGAAHDGGHGVLVHGGGAASHRFTAPACRGMGGRYASPGREAGGVGLFTGTATTRCTQGASP